MQLSKEETKHPDLLFMRFQVQSLELGTKSGFIIHNPQTFESPIKIDVGKVFVLNSLYSSNFVIYLGESEEESSENQVTIFHLQSQQAIDTLSFKKPILNLQQNKELLILVFPEKVKIFRFSDRKLMKKLPIKSKKGICELTRSEKNILAFPETTQKGNVRLFDGKKLENLGIINAHETQISCLAFNSNGTMLATTSQKGTTVKIFDVKSKQMIVKFKRGRNMAIIYSICFSENGKFLALTSNRGSLHVFKIPEKTSSGSITRLFGKPLSVSFSVCKLLKNIPTICSFSEDGSQIYAIDSNGKFSFFSFNSRNGKETALTKTIELFEND
ncbi:autophagy-related 18a [Anaeramoeba flamelloides]|uniref:Autophagy-related 18a n=1 Tax=Anaeramoeba flamelloides TaxID=1746091 RepID=A0ABQ8Y7S2_9EUKA|nr:autophagy-related 18a [Anaeramoeba flamelloides]